MLIYFLAFLVIRSFIYRYRIVLYAFSLPMLWLFGHGRIPRVVQYLQPFIFRLLSSDLDGNSFLICFGFNKKTLASFDQDWMKEPCMAWFRFLMSNCVSSYFSSSKTNVGDISNEVISEFFYLYLIFRTFLKLNIRFYNISLMIHHFRLNSIIHEYLKEQMNSIIHIIIPYQHRMNLSHLTKPFIYESRFSPHHIMVRFPLLKTLILENIEWKYLETLLSPLISLPNLSSLVILVFDLISNTNIHYCQLFRFLVLKCCKVSFKQRYFNKPLHIANNEFSPIVLFIINFDVSINYLNAIWSYL